MLDGIMGLVYLNCDMKNLSSIVLAAGLGKRMKSSVPKVLHRVCGKPMLFYPLKALKERNVRNTAVVIGHGADEVKDAFKGERFRFCLQKKQLGTGHAVWCAIKELKDIKGDILILSGDVPLITKDTVLALLKIHGSPEKPALSFISVILANPSGYGRVIRDDGGRVLKIVEDKDLKPGERDIREVNSGIYIGDSEFLRKNIMKLGKENRQKEYYLPDLIAVADRQGKKVKALTHVYPDEVMGINDRMELARANAVMRKRILEGLMRGGVTFIDPRAAYVDYGVKVGMDTTVYPNVHLLGDTSVGKDCVIEEGSRVKDSEIGGGSVIKSFTIVESSRIGKKVTLGPFARLRPGNTIGDFSRIGNFVEVKNTSIGKNTKANHLSYIGDSVIGKDVNIGAGTITCNYDGFKKHKTIIKDGVFIGSDTQLIAPVTVGKGAYIGSGSTITKDVPPGSLALSRAEQRIVKGWVKKRRLKERHR